ncbi:competence protein CoiA [Virgibacillus ihumii]|uniref:competence protein CoiA n=1 Tax=Virgibacillus ihumii TaxID=2686091 RepID=UPI00157DDF64|nr:competence protein CoiA family protein [Virgibacillus ihumii]
MLQAKMKNGVLVTLALLTRQEIMRLKGNRQQFRCPACDEPVIIKAGQKMVPHFAHRSKQNCPSSEGGEGAYHEKGKLLLYKWLRHQQLDVELEAYLPEIMQRPDVLLRVNNRILAIEYQCARIPVEQVHKRNKGYRQAGIIPIWILGANRLERRGQHQLKLDAFHLQFIHQFSSEFPLTLFFFCPQSFQFISFQDLFFTSQNKAIGKFSIRRLDRMRFTDVFHENFISNQAIGPLWVKEKQNLRIRAAKRLYGSEMTWHQWLYLKRTHKEYLPSIIHMPVRGQILMKTPPWDWQSRLCLDLIEPAEIGSAIPYANCKRLLQNHLQCKEYFPLLASVANPITQYLQLLEKLQVITLNSARMFTKKNPLHFHKNVEEALQGDKQLIELLYSNKIKAWYL